MIWAALTLALAASRETPEYKVPVGAGVETCRTWSLNKGLRRAADEQWLYGFLSGANFALAKSAEQKLLWPSDTPQDYVTSIDVYCAAHPQDTVDDAAKVLARRLQEEGGL